VNQKINGFDLIWLSLMVICEGVIGNSF